ncbi:MAG: histidine phosphatase family protein [Marmoricola sp.]|nr:histidine phosphatase family protein [Marmoricola sp.]
MKTTVHLLRHGEVYNPEGILYGRAPGFLLSDRGVAMAERVAERIGDRDITYLVASPLERAQQTAAPLAKVRGIDIVIDDRVIESTNVFEGKPFSVGDGVLRRPSAWKYLWNPFKPSWGEPYAEVAARMWAAVSDARVAAEGHEALIISHQLPIWICRLHAEKRRFLHDPRRRQCTLCSLTSFEFDGETLLSVGYAEPAGDMIPESERRAAFSAGTGFDEPDDR